MKKLNYTSSISHILLVCAIAFTLSVTPLKGHNNSEILSDIDYSFDQARESYHFTDGWLPLRDGLLADYGIDPHLVYIGEVISNISGGLKIGTVYNGLVDLGLSIDVNRFLGKTFDIEWAERGTFFVNFINLHGHASPTDKLSGSFSGVSNIDFVTAFASGHDSTRLYELFYEHIFENFIDNITFSLKAGQLTADSEFFGSEYGSIFINDTFGWAGAGPGASGAPAFPIATIGGRLLITVADEFYGMAAIYDNGNDGKTHKSDRHNFTWAFPDGERAVGIFELGYLPEAFPGFELPGGYKIGFWTAAQDTADNITATTIYNNNYGFYIVADQLIISTNDDDTEGLGIFFRFAKNKADRNTCTWYVDMGVNYSGGILTEILPSLIMKDTFALGFAHGKVSSSRKTGNPTVIYSDETVIEATYTATLFPWLSIQPDLQYIKNPNGPNGGVLKDAYVLSVRAKVIF